MFNMYITTILIFVLITSFCAAQNEEENLQLVQEAFSAWGQGNIPELLSMASGDLKYQLTGAPYVPDSGVYHGHEGFVEFLDRINEKGEFITFEPREFIVQGDTVVAIVYEDYKSDITDRSLGGAYAIFVFEIEDGKITEVREYLDTLLHYWTKNPEVEDPRS